MKGQPYLPGVMALEIPAVYVAEIDIEPPVQLPVPPIFIVDPNTPFEVWTEVRLTGKLISLLGGTGWTIEYYAERMGTGNDLKFGPVTGNWPPIAHNDTSETLGKNVTKFRVQVPEPGLYKLTCVFKSGASDYILGFAEGGMFQVADNC